MADTAAVKIAEGAKSYPNLKKVLEHVQKNAPIDPGDGNKAVEEFNAIIAKLAQSKTTAPAVGNNVPTITVDSPVLLRRPSATDHETIQRLKIEVHELQLRLSQMASEQLAESNPDLTDLSDINRPTKLAEMFSDLYAKEWTRTHQEMEASEENSGEVFYIELLLVHLKDSFEFCQKLVGEQLSSMSKAIEGIALHPDGKPRSAAHQAQCEAEINRARKYLRHYQKETAPAAVPAVQALYHEKVMNPVGGELKKYIDRCVQLCWLMNVQDPPMWIEIPEEMDETGRYTRLSQNFRHYTKNGAFIDFVVWPALYAYKGGALLNKGVAQGLELRSSYAKKT